MWRDDPNHTDANAIDRNGASTKLQKREMIDQNTSLILGRLEGKVDMILLRFESNDVRDAALDRRLKTVERKVWYASGFIGAIIAYLGLTHFLVPHS